MNVILKQKKKSTEFTDETTITLTFDDYKTVKGIMIHNSEWIESAFYEIEKQTPLLKGKLIVSCQALPHEPLHSSFIMGRMALAGKNGGTLIIKSPSRSVQKICRLAGLERLVKIEK